MSSDIPINDSNLQDIIKKEARGLGDDTDFGEVQEILGEYIITKRQCGQRHIPYS